MQALDNLLSSKNLLSCKYYKSANLRYKEYCITLQLKATEQ